MAEAIRPEERLFSLILALLATDRGLTKQEILGSVSGYRDRADSRDPKQVESLSKQFERDKDTVRDLGITIDTLLDPTAPDDNHNTRYRISKADYVLPPDLDFDAEELALLGLAATVWQEGSLSTESRRALTKLAGLGIAPADPMIGFLPAVRAADPALEELRGAIDDRVVVEFDYLKPSDAVPGRRIVSPVALVNHEWRWLLVAAEPDGTRKRFLLSRIVGKVRRTREAAIAPDEAEEARALAELDAFRAANRGVVRVVPGSDAEVRLTNRGDTAVLEPGALEVHWTDLALFADELVALHPGAHAVSTPELAERVVARLAEIGSRHG